MSEALEIAGWLLLSSVKYIIAVLALLAKSPRFWFYDFLIVSIGGSLGVVVFTYLGSFISNFFKKFSMFRVRFKNLRRFVFFKNGYGLVGLAFITPLISGIPLGTIIFTLFEPNKNKVLIYQLISVWAWSLLLFMTKAILLYFKFNYIK